MNCPKKNIAILCVLVLVLSSFAACSSTPNSAELTSSVEQTTKLSGVSHFEAESVLTTADRAVSIPTLSRSSDETSVKASVAANTTKTTNSSSTPKTDNTNFSQSNVTRTTAAPSTKPANPPSTTNKTPTSDSVYDKYKPAGAVKEIDKGVWIKQNGTVWVIGADEQMHFFENETEYNESVRYSKNYACPYCQSKTCDSIVRTYSMSNIPLYVYCRHPEQCPKVNVDGTTGDSCESCGKPFMVPKFYISAGFPAEYCDGYCGFTIH